MLIIRLFIILVLSLISPTLFAQDSKEIRTLKQQKSKVQQTLKKSKSELQNTQKKVKSGQKDLKVIHVKIEERIARIQRMEEEMADLEKQIKRIQSNIAQLSRKLEEKKNRFRTSVRYIRHCKQQNSPLLFILSSENFLQMSRRIRYAKDYALYQKELGNQILRRQSEILVEQNKLLRAKTRMNTLLQEVIKERKELNLQQIKKENDITELKKKEKGLANQVAKQQKQLAALDKKIDNLIALEIERSKKRAEANKKQSSSKSTSKSTQKVTWLTAQDQKLNGSFVQNKGRLPIPITGPYRIGGRFGVYQVSGLKNVRLDNKGTNFMGQAGARARSVFEGVVTAVFQFDGTYNVLIRHGSYISVYCNLASVSVHKDQKVQARDIVGTVAKDEQGDYILHFQLRKETVKLNPEHWIAR